MESLSRPFHRRKLSNASTFTGKNAYDGVFSGHRPKFDGAPAVNLEEYNEIFSSGQADSSIPVLDLSTLEESSDAPILELGTSKPDYSKIFGGFRDEDIAVSYEDLVARDKARGPSSTSQSSQNSGDLSQQSPDALKQFNMSYNKISQRSKDGLDGKTHVAKLHAVPGFTCFIDESASQPKKESEKPKSSVTNNIHHEKQTSQSGVKSLFDDQVPTTFTFQVDDIKSQPTKVSPSLKASENKDEAASQPKKEIEKQKSYVANDVQLGVDSSKVDFLEKQKSQSGIESRSKYHHDKSLSEDKIFKTFQADPKVSNVEDYKYFQKRSTTTNTSEAQSCFDEELDANSAAATSAAALRKAIEKAQESIRIAKESVGKKKEGLRSKSFKDTLKVKPKVVPHGSTSEEPKEQDNRTKETFTGFFSKFVNSEKLFGAKKVLDEIHVKISESSKNSEIPTTSSCTLKDDKIVSDSEEAVDEIKTVENNAHEEAPQKDNQRPNGFLELESCEKNLEDSEEGIKDEKSIESKENNNEERPSNGDKLAEEFNNLTVYTLKGEDEKKIFSEENIGLLENNKQEVVEEVDDEEASEKVLEDEREPKEDKETESRKEEDIGEKFYDVCEVEMIEKHSQTFTYSLLRANDVSPKEEENQQSEETWKESDNIQEPEVYETSSSDYDDAEAIEAGYTSEEKEILENITADQISSQDYEDEREANSADMAQTDSQSESSSDTINGMEIEVKEYNKNTEETIQIKTETNTETVTEIETDPEAETTQEPKVEEKEESESREAEPIKVAEEKEIPKRIKEVSAEEREWERNRLAVERAIREARERAFAEARQKAAVEKLNAEIRQRVIADKNSAQSKLRAERAAVERATAEARQRALEKAMSQKKLSEPKIQVNEIRQTPSSDVHVSNGTGTSTTTTTESALRSKAKLEKHNRIMERAAKALAEKEKRDLLVQREQAERSRLAESLDADIKRWSTGKEGNLRALLSTLQYILGADSGWQPVSLTEIITSSAVKKAYRKATLCVHPDKLQQRGASIQQKYICEKVFDLLKAAWNRFNSEER